MIGRLGELVFSIIAEDKTEEGTKSATDRFARTATVVGSSLAAVGGASLAFIDKAKQINSTYEILSVQTGIAADEFRNLALETANVSFPLESVNATFDLLVKSGLKTKEEIQDAANAFDNLADATGNDAAIVTQQLIPAFNAFGIPLQEAGKHTDSLTYLLRNTTIELGDFSQTIDKLSPDMDKLGLSMDQTVAIMKALSDKGIQGSAATREFRTAVSAAEGDVNKLLESLGLTNEELKPYQAEIANATGLTDKFAEAANTEFSILDKVKNEWTELQVRIGTALEPMEMAFAGMTAIGSVMAGLGPIMTMFSGVQLSTVIPTLTAHAAAAWAAAAPYLAIILPIAAVIAVLIILEKKFGLITKTIELVSKGFEILVKWFKETIPKAIDATKKGLDLFIKFIGMTINPIGTIVTAFGGWSKIFDIVKGVFDRVINFIKGIIPVFKEAGKNIILNLVNGIMTMINKPYELMFEALRKVRNLLPFSPAKEGPLSKPVSWESYLVDPLEKLNPKLKTSLSAGLDLNANTASVSGGSTINIGTVNLDTKYNFEAFMKDVEAWQRKNTLQRGYRTI